MIGWSAEDLLAYLESDSVSEYRSSGHGQGEGILDLPIDYTMAMPSVGEFEPADHWLLSPPAMERCR